MNVICFLVLVAFSSFSYASKLSAKPVSFGSVASSINEPIDVVSGFIAVGCLIVGVACLFAALVKYFEHRRSPLFVPISTVIWLVIIALLLLLLPFAYIITGNGIPLSILWGG